MATETPRWPQRRRESAANEAAREEVDPRVIIPGRPACTNDCLPYIRLGKLPGTRSREISEGPKGPAVDGATAVRPSAGQAGSLQPVHFGSIQVAESGARRRRIRHQPPVRLMIVYISLRHLNFRTLPNLVSRLNVNSVATCTLGELGRRLGRRMPHINMTCVIFSHIP